MSCVTNLILSLPILECHLIEEVNKFSEFKNFPLISCDDPKLPRGWYGGQKMLEAEIYIGSYNYFDTIGFLEYLNKIDWESKEEVQIFVKEQEENIFKLIHL